jgi:hypothetical protein
MKAFWVVLAGVLVTGNGGMVVDRVASELLPNLSPSALPGTVSDLRVMAVSDTSVALSWTEVNSGNTAIARYAVRVVAMPSPTPGPDEVFRTVTDACGTPVYGSTAGGGQVRSCVVTGLQAVTQYGAQLVAFTGAYGTATNFGLKSNTVLAVTARRFGPSLLIHPSGGAGTPFTLRRVTGTAFPSETLAFPLRGTFATGDYYFTALDDSGRVSAKGYLYVVKP